ncbi:hypothetical protein MTBBW1_300050 [Desulfamplus magnetovallimortis]|uniref:Uncharacterized protein n=1 Tax=Desulfamplus magnetovallimortis TaxID=1246637 RepID=A0A1W1HFR4_9BACT|nr:hypothetical protein MTBBW1_300050 [Desulfamplus magnetovallimortis]
MFCILFAVEHLHDLFDVRFCKDVVIGLFLEQAAGIDELGGGVGLVFGEHQNVDGDGGAEKEVGRK